MEDAKNNALEGTNPLQVRAGDVPDANTWRGAEAVEFVTLAGSNGSTIGGCGSGCAPSLP